MFCGNCGKELPDGSTVCQYCGYLIENKKDIEKDTSDVKAPVDSSVNEPVTTTGLGDSASEENTSTETPKKKSNLIILIGAAVALITIIAVIIGVSISSGRTINLNDYLKFKTTGYDGYGSLKYAIDWDSIEEEYGSKLKYTSEAEKKFGSLLSLTNPIEIIKEYVDLDLDNKKDLCNGDVVKYTWDIDDTVYKFVKCNLKYKDDEIEVNDFSEVKTFDAFKSLDVEFNGTAPDGEMSYTYNGSEFSSRYFSCDKKRNLSNGDVVTFTIDISEEDCLEVYGKVPAEYGKKYIVSGLRELEQWDPFDCLTVSFSGYDSYGEVNLVTSENIPVSDGRFIFSDTNDLKNGRLTNGDIIYVDYISDNWFLDVDELAYTEGLTLTRTKAPFIVSGLNESGKFNPFDYVTVSFDGQEPIGKAIISLKEDLPDFWSSLNVTFEASSNNLNNGDTLKVSFITTNGNDIISRCHMYDVNPTALEKEYTVSGLRKCAKTAAEILSCDLSTLILKSNGTFSTKSWNDPSSFKGIEPYGYIFLTGNENTKYRNILYLLYNITVKNDKVDFNYFYYTAFYNVAISDDGSGAYSYTDFSGCSNTYKYNNLYYYGFEDINTIYQYIIEQNSKYEMQSKSFDGSLIKRKNLDNNYVKMGKHFYKEGKLKLSEEVTDHLEANYDSALNWYKVEIPEKGMYSFNFICEDLPSYSSYNSYFDAGLYSSMNKENKITQKYIYGGNAENTLYIGELDEGVYYFEVESANNYLNSEFTIKVSVE